MKHHLPLTETPKQTLSSHEGRLRPTQSVSGMVSRLEGGTHLGTRPVPCVPVSPHSIHPLLPVPVYHVWAHTHTLFS